MTEINRNITDIKKQLPEDCTLIAVSKTKPLKFIQEAYESGHKDFGENKVQELVHKFEELPKDIHWHMVGHLQRNKVKYIAPFVYLIHAVDSLRLMTEINKQAKNYNRIINCLLQVHIADEETKHGFTEDEIRALFENNEAEQFENIRFCGLMGMATNSRDKIKVSGEFSSLKKLYDELKNKNHVNTNFQYLSMGMSGDYHLAIEEGSNMVRVGSAIFGTRQNN